MWRCWFGSNPPLSNHWGRGKDNTTLYITTSANDVCKIYATVGNEQKRKYLVENHQIPEDRIFDSRSISFFDDVMRHTNGRGVDLVLNSLSGELLHASWRCVAEFGRMIELGKRDILGHAQLNMDGFSGNRAYFGVDLFRLGETDTTMFGQYVFLFSYLSVLIIYACQTLMNEKAMPRRY